MKLFFYFLRTIRDGMERWRLKIRDSLLHRGGLLHVQEGASLHLDGFIKATCPGNLKLESRIYKVEEASSVRLARLQA